MESNAWLEAFKYALPLVGVGIGWLLNQLGEKFKAAREDKRRIRKAIFYLLEVRHHLSFFTGNEQGVRRYITIVRKKFSCFFPKEITDEQLASAISAILKVVIKDKPLITDEDLKNLRVNYNKSVDSLSEIDPILAFRLQGRQNIQDILKDISQRMKTSLGELTNDPKDQSEVENAFEKLGPNVIEGLLDDLDEIILDLAKKIDKATFKAAQKRLIMTMSIEQTEQLEKFAKTLLKGLIPAGIE